MKIAVILNGISLRRKFFYDKIMPALQKAHNTDVFETHSRHDAVFLASKAADKGYSIILAAGGDGTMNQVLNGVIRGRENDKSLPAIGVIPIGSGNDFARTLNVSSNVNELLQLITADKYTYSDVGRIQYKTLKGEQSYSYFINVADAGMGPEVVRRVMNSDKIFGAAVAYYSAILSAFSRYKPMEVQMKTEQWEWKGKLMTLAIGNGKYYGHGLCIAPDASINDGSFSTFTCGNVSKSEFVWHSGKLKTGKKIVHPNVSYNTARHLELSSDQPCMIEADGELLGLLPATVDIIPGKIKVLC